MSAFMVSRAHIRYLVEAATSRALARGDVGGLSWYWNRNRDAGTYERGNLGVVDFEGMARVANMLRRENLASINARYPDTIGHPENRPGVIGEPDEFEIEDFSRGIVTIDPAQVMRACRCYEYQACEHDGWDASEAKAFTDALYRHAAEALCEADAKRRGVELKWGIDEIPQTSPEAVSISAMIAMQSAKRRGKATAAR